MAEQNKTFVRCKEGWVVYQPIHGGAYQVTATGYRAEIVPALELRGVVQELVMALGGKERK